MPSLRWRLRTLASLYLCPRFASPTSKLLTADTPVGEQLVPEALTTPSTGVSTTRQAMTSTRYSTCTRYLILLVPYSANLLLVRVASSSKKEQIFQNILFLDTDNKVLWFIRFLGHAFLKLCYFCPPGKPLFSFSVRMPTF